MGTNGSWLAKTRTTAWDAYKAAPSPDRSAHVWRYTDPAPFLLPDATVADEARPGIMAPSAPPPAGLDVLELAEAVKTHGDLLASRWGTAVPPEQGKLQALNAARWQGGLFVRAPRNLKAERPLMLRSVLGAGRFNASRLVIEVEDGADVTVVREYLSEGAAPLHENGVIEIFAGANSRVRLVVIQDFAAGALLHLAQRTIAGRGAHVETLMCSLGGSVTKADIGTVLAGEGASSESWGIVSGRARQHYDHHTVHEHRAGRTHSNFDYKTVLRNHARSVYTGVIRIDEGAKNCEAYQENRNLMLDTTATADSIPELEILNDEVRCTHGATMGPIEPEYLFYLESRGIPPHDAQQMFIEGFVEAGIARLPEVLAVELRRRLGARLEAV